MEHLLNCHGEWYAIAGMVTALPFIGPWIKTKLHRRKEG